MEKRENGNDFLKWAGNLVDIRAENYLFRNLYAQKRDSEKSLFLLIDIVI